MTRNKEPQVTDAAAIAEELSKAQRAAIMNARESMFADKMWFGKVHGNVMLALHRLGLSDYQYSPARLTPTGLAVRKILQERAA